MREIIVHSFEAGRRGKPDELDSIIANAIAAYCIKIDNNSRFDIRVSGGYSPKHDKLSVFLAGEISENVLNTPNFEEDVQQVVVDAYNGVHRTQLKVEDLHFKFAFKSQSVALATNSSKKTGDSGATVAVAYKKGPFYLPWERFLAVGVRDIIDGIFLNDGKVPQELAEKSGVSEIIGLVDDGKIEVNAEYDGAELLQIRNITIATVHKKSLPVAELRESLTKVINAFLEIESKKWNADLGSPEIVINGADDWNFGGWLVDAGTREAKPYRDAFSSYGVCDDAFSGEDPTKASATGTLIGRHIAVNLVANGYADFARVAISYIIGRAEISINVFTNGTLKVSQEEIHEIVKNNFTLSIGEAIEKFELNTPEHYLDIVKASDFFQDENFPWNKVIEIKN